MIHSMRVSVTGSRIRGAIAIRKSRQLFARIGTVVAIGLFASGILVSPASADLTLASGPSLSQPDSIDRPPTTVTAHRVVSSTEAAAAAASVITCTASNDRAHLSNETGQPNTHGQISCTAPVYKIESRVFINRDGIEVGASAFLQNYGKKFISGTANAPSCVRGSYRGATTGYIIFPSGYTPATAQVYGLGQVATLC